MRRIWVSLPYRLQRSYSTSPSINLSEKQLAVQELCRNFAKNELAPVASKLDQSGEFPSKQIALLGDLGLMGMTAPKIYNGSELDYMSVSLGVEELSRGCASTGSIVSIHNLLYVDFLSVNGNDEQKSKFLTPCTGRIPGAFALSESDAGSDVANIQTTARETGDGYILNGSKAWVTSGIEAENAIVFATVDKQLKHKGIVAFLVPLNAKGVQKGKAEDKLGIRAASACDLHLTDVFVPKENLVGAVGNGFKLAMLQLNKARIGIASQALGIAQASLDAALAYASTRKAFGSPIFEMQAVKMRLARMAVSIESSRLLVRKAALMCDNDENFTKNSAIAKLTASETATFAAHNCVQIMGGMGYVKAMPAERFYRDARITEIYGGVSDVQMMVIADQAMKEFKENR